MHMLFSPEEADSTTDNKFQEMQKLMETALQVRFTNLELERECCQQLLRLAAKWEYAYGVAFAHTYLGDYYVATNDNDRCSFHLARARQFCREGAFDDLLQVALRLSGILFDALRDEQTALNHYLEGLTLARKLGDRSAEVIIYNNIGAEFNWLGDRQSAQQYFLRVYEMLNLPEVQISDNTRLVLLGNLAEIHAQLGQWEECRRFMDLIDQVPVLDPNQRLALYIARFLYAAHQGEAAVLALCDELLSLQMSENADLFLAYLAAQSMCEEALRLDNQRYAYQALTLMQRQKIDCDAYRTQSLQRLAVEYYRRFGTAEELAQAHRDYYLATREVERCSNEVRVRGMEACLSLCKRVKERREVQQRYNHLEELAHIDELTSLYNRRYFNKALTKALGNVQLQHLGFVIVDLDYFKEYNDHYGHRGGDQILRMVSECLSQAVIEGMTICRYGGDEFACLCADCTDQQIEQYVHQVRSSMEALSLEHISSKCSDQVTLSIGWCNYAEPRLQDVSQLFAMADKALYQVKLSGRNGVARL